MKKTIKLISIACIGFLSIISIQSQANAISGELCECQILETWRYSSEPFLPPSDHPLPPPSHFSRTFTVPRGYPCLDPTFPNPYEVYGGSFYDEDYVWDTKTGTKGAILLVITKSDFYHDCHKTTFNDRPAQPTAD